MLWLVSKNNIRAGTGRQQSLWAQNTIIHTGNLLHAWVQTHTMAHWLPVKSWIKTEECLSDMDKTECFLVELFARNGVKWKFVCEDLKVSLFLSLCICYTWFAGIRMQIRFSWSKHRWKSMTACRRRCVLKTYEVTVLTKFFLLTQPTTARNMLIFHSAYLKYFVRTKINT